MTLRRTSRTRKTSPPWEVALSTVSLVLFLGLFALFLGCARRGTSSDPPRTEGTLVYERAGETLSYTIDVCKSGEAYDFYGVILQDESAPSALVKLVEDPLTEKRTVRFGYSAKAEPNECYECVGSARGVRPDETVHYFEAGERCAVFETEIENTNTTGHFLYRKGRLSIDCSTPKGDRVRVDAVFRSCG